MCLVTHVRKIHNQREIKHNQEKKSGRGVRLLIDAPNVCLPLEPPIFE